MVTYGDGPSGETRLHLRPKAQIEVRRHRAGGGNARPRCILMVRVSHYSKRKNAGMALSHSCIFGPSGETRTRGILVPNQAPYQLGHTRKYFVMDNVVYYT